jgi:hypothetical protein
MKKNFTPEATKPKLHDIPAGAGWAGETVWPTNTKSVA